MSVEVAGRKAFAKLFEAVHLRYCAASSVIPSQLSLQSLPEILAGTYGFVSRDSAGGSWFTQLGILARRDDRSGSPSRNHIVASAHVIGTISVDGGNLLVGRDLLQKVSKHGSIADIACRDANCADQQCFLIQSEVELTPQTFFAPSMFRRVPFSFTLSLDPGRIDQQMLWALLHKLLEGFTV